MITAVSSSVVPSQNVQNIQSRKQVSMTGNLSSVTKTQTPQVEKTLVSIAKKIRRVFNEAVDSLVLKKLHIYDDNNNLVEIHKFNFRNDDNDVTYFAKEYCQNGKISTRKLYDMYDGQIKKKYDYIATGAPGKVESYDNGVCTSRLTYNYAIGNGECKQDFFNRNGSLKASYTTDLDTAKSIKN